jgi:hypothetical protein
VPASHDSPVGVCRSGFFCVERSEDRRLEAATGTEVKADQQIRQRQARE